MWTQGQFIGGGSSGGLREIQIVQDSGGTLCVVFSDSSSGNPKLYFVRSEDNGRTWSAPLVLSNDVVEGRFQVSLLAHNDALHVAFLSEDGVQHLRSDDAGTNWSPPVSLEVMGQWPKLVGLDDEQLLLLTVGTTEEESCVKLQNRSPDSGRNWGETQVLFLPVRGCLGNAPIQVDSGGDQHLVMSAYLRPAFVEMMWHSVWLGDQWAAAELLHWPKLSYEAFGTQPDFPTAAISEGNILHAAFMVDEGHIWYTKKRLSATALQSNVFPTPTETAIEVAATDATLTPARMETPEAQALVTTPPDNRSKPLIYLLPIAVSVAVVCVAILRRRR